MNKIKKQNIPRCNGLVTPSMGTQGINFIVKTCGDFKIETLQMRSPCREASI